MPEPTSQARPSRPQPPEKPEPGDCCGGGCARCVFDTYENALERYETALASWQSNQ